MSLGLLSDALFKHFLFLIPLLSLALLVSPRATLEHSDIAPLSPRLFHVLPHDVDGIA